MKLSALFSTLRPLPAALAGLALRFESQVSSRVHAPRNRLEGWARTVFAAAAVLLAVQIMSGVLLAFYFVPSADHAYVTVSYIEKVVSLGSWIRAMHSYASVGLAAALLLQLAQMYAFRTAALHRAQWYACLVLLLFALANGTTGYSLPWDARALAGAGITEGIARRIPFIGRAASQWLLGSTEVSSLTLTRFYAMHIVVVPAVAALAVLGLSRLKRNGGELVTTHGQRVQMARHAITASATFVAIAVYAWKTHAPLGPAGASEIPGYLPRPGAQFRWLFETLKFVPTSLAFIPGIILPGVILLWLAALPRLVAKNARAAVRRIQHACFVAVLVLVGSLTALSYLDDYRNKRTREQLAAQAAQEEVFRALPFEPAKLRIGGADPGEQQRALPGPDPDHPPAIYLDRCSLCHGNRGEGSFLGPSLRGITNKPKRTAADIAVLLRDPVSYGLKPPMKSFQGKLTEEQMREIAEWIVTLKK